MSKRLWSDLNENEKNELLKTEPNEAYFWTGGRPDGMGEYTSGVDRAAEVANESNGKTLEMKLDEGNINQRKMNDADWKEASDIFAKNASGDVHCVKSGSVRPDSVYNKVEKPEIDDNPKISSMSEVDPITGHEKASYDRNPETGKLENIENGEEFNEGKDSNKMSMDSDFKKSLSDNTYSKDELGKNDAEKMNSAENNHSDGNNHNNGGASEDNSLNNVLETERGNLQGNKIKDSVDKSEPEQKSTQGNAIANSIPQNAEPKQTEDKGEKLENDQNIDDGIER